MDELFPSIIYLISLIAVISYLLIYWVDVAVSRAKPTDEAIAKYCNSVRFPMSLVYKLILSDSIYTHFVMVREHEYPRALQVIAITHTVINFCLFGFISTGILLMGLKSGTSVLTLSGSIWVVALILCLLFVSYQYRKVRSIK